MPVRSCPSIANRSQCCARSPLCGRRCRPSFRRSSRVARRCRWSLSSLRDCSCSLSLPPVWCRRSSRSRPRRLCLRMWCRPRLCLSLCPSAASRRWKSRRAAGRSRSMPSQDRGCRCLPWGWMPLLPDWRDPDIFRIPSPCCTKTWLLRLRWEPQLRMWKECYFDSLFQNVH